MTKMFIDYVVLRSVKKLSLELHKSKIINLLLLLHLFNFFSLFSSLYPFRFPISDDYYAPRPAERSDAGRGAFYFFPYSDSYQVTTC